MSSTKDHIDYVLEKLKTYDLVMIGERHWTREEPMFMGLAPRVPPAVSYARGQEEQVSWMVERRSH